MSGRTRLMKEMKESARDGDPSIVLAPDGENLYRWSATLRGPEETPFETGTFVVRFVVPESYPLAPPKASFVTKIFHPNVHFRTGEICLDVLKDQWSPAWTLHSVCRAILALMRDPEPDSPLNCDGKHAPRSRRHRVLEHGAYVHPAGGGRSDLEGSLLATDLTRSRTRGLGTREDREREARRRRRERKWERK